MRHANKLFVHLNEANFNFDFVEHCAGKYMELPGFTYPLSAFRKAETRGEKAFKELEKRITH